MRKLIKSARAAIRFFSGVQTITLKKDDIAFVVPSALLTEGVLSKTGKSFVLATSPGRWTTVPLSTAKHETGGRVHFKLMVYRDLEAYTVKDSEGNEAPSVMSDVSF